MLINTLVALVIMAPALVLVAAQRPQTVRVRRPLTREELLADARRRRRSSF